MNRHGSLNRIYRLIWNDALQAYVPVAETTRGRGKRSAGGLAAAVATLGAGLVQAAPSGGHVTAGSGTISATGTTTTVEQSSQNLSLTWQSFNVAGNETVDFVQPTAAAIAVNRILGSDGSVILGRVNANGQVYLINPNGVLFGRGAVLNVGGLVASTLDLDDATLGNASKTFQGTGRGSVSNEGLITASTGGSVALLGNRVANTGVIAAQLGTVTLGAGSAATLTFSGTHLVKMQVDRSTLASEAANGGLIRADGGTVLMTAGAQKSLLASVVNNTGVIEARTIDNHAGTITLLGGMTAGTVDVAGTLDASAPDAGNGGTIETSAAHVRVAPAARIDAAAAHGLNGTWLIDPTDFTIAASGGDMTGATLSAELVTGNVIIDSNAGAGGTSGNIVVDDTVSWSANALTLSAQNNIAIGASLNGSGTAALALYYGQGAPNLNNVSTYSIAAPVNLAAGAHFSTKLGADGAITNFTVITDLGVAADALFAPSVTTLQGMAASGNLAGNFVLGANIDASATSGWNACGTCVGGGAGHYGFTPIGNGLTAFSGTFDGLGHTIDNLFISRPQQSYVGLLGFSGGVVRNVGLNDAAIAGYFDAGGLIGQNYGSVGDSFVAGGSVTGVSNVGGLIGVSYDGAIARSHSTAGVSGTGIDIGGLVGHLEAPSSITDSYATGAVTGSSYTGGLVGSNDGGNLARVYATGQVSGSDYVGGLIGENSGSLDSAFATGNVLATGSQSGGLIGYNYGPLSNVHAAGSVTGLDLVGGLLGQNQGSVTNAYATGAVASQYVSGGLIGVNYSQLTNTYATGNVTAGSYAGGLVAFNDSGIAQSFATGNVTGTQFTGGLIGRNAYGPIVDTYATGAVSGTNYVGGLIGLNGGSVATSYARGTVTATVGTLVGGLIGFNGGLVSNSFYDITANATLTGSGGVANVAGSIWGLSASDLQLSANFTTATAANGNENPAWNLATTWIVYDGHTAPLSQAFMTPLTVGTGPVTATYDAGTAFALTPSALLFSSTPDMTHVFGAPTIGGTVGGAVHVGTYTSAVGGLYSDQFGYKITFTPVSLTITPAPLTVAGTASTATKTYDGTTTASLTGGALVGVLAGDSVTLDQTGTFASPHVGTNIAVTATETLGGTNAGDYTLTEPTGVSGSITPAPLTVSGTTVGNKVYDGTTSATLTTGVLVGVVQGDQVSLTQAGAFAAKNAGTAIVVTAADTVSGTAASDYTLVQPTGLSANISPAPLSVAGSSAGNKVYDGSTTASLSGGTLVGVAAGDDVTLTQTGTFATKNVGTGIAVGAADTLGGADAANYTISEPAGLIANIAPASLTVGNTLVAGKIYDGTTGAQLTGGSLVGVVTGDTVTLTQAGYFTSKNAGPAVGVTVNDGLSGASAGNYVIVEPTGLTAAIAPAAVSVNDTAAGNKIYDGSTAASLTGGSLSGVISGDQVTLMQSGTFASKNVGTGIAVTANDALSGADAGNYAISQPAGLSADIAPASLTVSGTTIGSRLANGSTAAPVKGGTLVGVIGGDTVTLDQSGIFATATAGFNIPVTVTDALSGSSAADYTLVEPTGLTGTLYSASVLSSPSVRAALGARAQIESDLMSPSFGGTLQTIRPSTTMDSLDDAPLAQNVTLKIGAAGTLRVENGGLRLPNNLAGKE